MPWFNGQFFYSLWQEKVVDSLRRKWKGTLMANAKVVDYSSLHACMDGWRTLTLRALNFWISTPNSQCILVHKKTVDTGQSGVSNHK